MLKVYFAEFDINYPGYEQYKFNIQKLCLFSGIEPLFTNSGLTGPQACLYNVELIKQADILIADLNPSKENPKEPTPNVILECEQAFEFGKTIIGFTDNISTEVSHFGSLLNIMQRYQTSVYSSVDRAILDICQEAKLPQV